MGQNNENSNLSADDKLFEDDDDPNESFLHPQQRNAANARERARMRVLSRAFCRLKTTLPWVPPDTKLSKLDTLRLATSYIAHLRAVLKLSENEPTKHTTRQPTNMNWPFNFNNSTWEKQSTTRSDDSTRKLQWNGYDDCKDSQKQANLFYGARGKRRTIENNDGNRNSTNTISSKIRRKRNANNYQQRSQFSQQSYSDGEIIGYNPQNNYYYKPYSMF